MKMSLLSLADWGVRLFSVFFAIAFALLLGSFSTAVDGPLSLPTMVTFGVLASLSQLGLLLTTFSFTSKFAVLKLASALLMLPCFWLLLSSTVFSSSFIGRLSGNSVQILSSVAYMVGVLVYIYGFLRLALRDSAI